MCIVQYRCGYFFCLPYMNQLLKKTTADTMCNIPAVTSLPTADTMCNIPAVTANTAHRRQIWVGVPGELLQHHLELF